MVTRIGTLDFGPVGARPDLVADPVRAVLDGWARTAEVGVAEIDAKVSDTAAFTQAHEVPPAQSANCVVVAGRRAGEEKVAAVVVLATTRADINGVVRRLLDVRRASFLAMDLAVEWTGMEYGGITPIGLPDGWPILVDRAVTGTPYVVVGSGVRHSKLAVPGDALAELAGAEVVDGLGQLL